MKLYPHSLGVINPNNDFSARNPKKNTRTHPTEPTFFFYPNLTTPAHKLKCPYFARLYGRGTDFVFASQRDLECFPKVHHFGQVDKKGIRQKLFRNMMVDPDRVLFVQLGKKALNFKGWWWPRNKICNIFSSFFNRRREQKVLVGNLRVEQSFWWESRNKLPTINSCTTIQTFRISMPLQSALQ